MVSQSTRTHTHIRTGQHIALGRLYIYIRRPGSSRSSLTFGLQVFGEETLHCRAVGVIAREIPVDIQLGAVSIVLYKLYACTYNNDTTMNEVLIICTTCMEFECRDAYNHWSLWVLFGSTLIVIR